MKDRPLSRNPWSFLPTLYFSQGLPYAIVNIVSTLFYVNMGIPNDVMAKWTSWLMVPWILKLFWAPTVDMYSTKRKWILVTQVAMAFCIVAAAVMVHSPHFFYFTFAAFLAAAFVSATYDIASDGFYMLAFDQRSQALYNGFRAGFYRLAMVFGSGVLVYVAGKLEVSTGSIPSSWMTVLLIAATLFLVMLAYHSVMLPHPPADQPPRSRVVGSRQQVSFNEVIKVYFRQERVGVLIAFILFYRLGEAMLNKMVQPFLKNARTAGGLGLTTSEVGLVYGTVGIFALVIGGVLGGWLVSRYGLRKMLWPLVITMHLPDLFFVYMAYVQPSISWAYPLVALEQFGYGLGFTVFTVFLMYSAVGEYKTSHYAISTGIMALGMWLATYWSGEVQKFLGYPRFFILVCFLTIPGMLTIPFLPKERMEKTA